MLRLAPVVILICASLLLLSCGEEGGLTGSECEIISCNYDKIVCQRYASPQPPAIIVHYKRVLEEGERWTAQIVIDLQGLESAEGQRFDYDPESPDDNEFTNRVALNRPGEDEQWPAFSGKFCEIKKGGDTPGEDLSGKCSFAFDNGYFLTAEFDCELEAATPP